MALFSKKAPMEKWRSQNRVMASFADASGWDVDLGSGAVHTVIGGVVVTMLAHAAGNYTVGVVVEAGAQAERTLANTFGDDGGEPFEFDGWQGVAAPGSGLIEGVGSGSGFDAQVIAAATELVTRVSRAR